jgi:serine protease SohB
MTGAAKPMPDLLKMTLDGLGPLVPARFRSDTPVVPVVRLSGIIGTVTQWRPGLTLASQAKVLDKAFGVRNARAVALLINSPGGSPAQSHLIFRRIRELAAEKKLPVLAFVEDVGASGGYMLSCAADEIFADPFSVVGSIGVVSGGFGFEKLIDKIGIERRLHTSGERKAMLDPFLPEKPEDVERLKTIQKDIHEHFIALVKDRRGARLAGTDETLFSGEFWTAPGALELGLIDGIGELRSVLRARYGEKVRTPLISAERGSLVRRLLGLHTPDVSVPRLADDLLAILEERAVWSRYGL